MPLGTCDPASRGETWNEGEQTQGSVRITYRYGWDGVSVRDSEVGCVGPLNRVTATNTSPTETWYVHFTGRKGLPKTLTLTPGFNQTYTQNQLRQQGFDDNTDLSELIINQTP